MWRKPNINYVRLMLRHFSLEVLPCIHFSAHLIILILHTLFYRSHTLTEMYHYFILDKKHCSVEDVVQMQRQAMKYIKKHAYKMNYSFVWHHNRISGHSVSSLISNSCGPLKKLVPRGT